MLLTYLGDCRDESLIEEIFGSVSEFARLVEEKGNNFFAGAVCVKYDKKKDRHSFFSVD